MMRDRHTIKSLTFKEVLNGPNITKAQAIENSANWQETEPDAAELDNIPSTDDWGTQVHEAAPSAEAPPPAEAQAATSRRAAKRAPP